MINWFQEKGANLQEHVKMQYIANVSVIYHILQPINCRVARHVQIGVFSSGNWWLSAP